MAWALLRDKWICKSSLPAWALLLWIICSNTPLWSVERNGHFGVHFPCHILVICCRRRWIVLKTSVGWSLVASQVGVTSLEDAAWIHPSKGSIWAPDYFSEIIIPSLQFIFKCCERGTNSEGEKKYSHFRDAEVSGSVNICVCPHGKLLWSLCSSLNTQWRRCQVHLPSCTSSPTRAGCMLLVFQF